MIALRASTIVAEEADLANGWLTIEGSRLGAAGDTCPDTSAGLDLGDVVIAPGLIDLHIHGREGCDVMDADPASLATISRSLAACGVTGFLATTVTTTWERTLDALRVIAAIDGMKLPGAAMLGAYSEGVFFNPLQKGAHNEAYFLKPSPDRIRQLAEAAAGKLKVLALAPEIEGAMESLVCARKMGMRVMLGHSDADFDQTCRALAAGGSGGVHIFNGMRGIHHRDPGCAGAVLLNPAMVEVIADGEHLHPAILDLIARLKNPDEILLISDCMCAGGMDDGDYVLGETGVRVTSGVVRTPQGGLAGSTLTLDKAVGHFARAARIGFNDGLRLASMNPARFLGMDQEIGSIRPGKGADLVILSQEHKVFATVVAGRLIHCDPDWALADALHSVFANGTPTG